MNFDTVIQQLYTLESGRRRSSLLDYQAFLGKLGNPHENLSPVIHVAGTNGKGSTIAILKSLLNQAGYSTHVYTSPHLIDITERIQLNGQPIPREELYKYLKRILLLQPQSFFEALTAAAFLAFQDYPTDFILLETGMGGRLDPTNVIHPLCSVITSIGWDHEKYLGNTLEAIAHEKAGIIKPGRPAILQKTDPTLKALSRRYSENVYLSGNFEPTVSLQGSHQQQNASLALSVLDIIGVYLSDQQKAVALQQVQWPGRLQRIQRGHQTWILDGAHNKSAAQILAKHLKGEDLKDLTCIFSLEKSRTIEKFLSPLKGIVKNIYVLENQPIRNPHCYKDIQAVTRVLGIECNSISDLEDVHYESHILVTGSLHLVGYALKQLDQQSH